MTLLDTDKVGDNRSTPKLNASDALPAEATKAHATDGIAYRAEDAIETPRVVTKDDQIIVFDGSFNKALFGRDGSGNYVVKVAKDGFNVLTATDSELIFNSAQNTFKIVASGTVSFTPANSGSPNYTVTSGRKAGPVITHGLGEVPGVQAYTQRPSVSFDPNTLTLLPFLESNGTSSVLINAFYSVTATTLSFFFDFGGSWSFNAVPNFNIRYYLLQETAT